MNKLLCFKCSEIAVWMYMPGTNVYCDRCVPRGCYCNWFPESNDDFDNYDKYIENKDEQGRSFPCCEYEFDPEGFEKMLG